jgi:hypothetical protein
MENQVVQEDNSWGASGESARRFVHFQRVHSTLRCAPLTPHSSTRATTIHFHALAPPRFPQPTTGNLWRRGRPRVHLLPHPSRRGTFRGVVPVQHRLVPRY